MRRSVLIGHGHALPAQVVTNRDLEKKLDTTHEWIVERTGIHQRHVVAAGEHTSHLAARAAQDALTNAKLTANDIDLLVLATTTPDDTMPSTATRVQGMIGMTQGCAFDVNAACSGFVYALHVTNAMLQSGAAKRALVIGADTFSRILNWEDRGTCVLFGDGAGAFILEAQEQPQNSSARGILYSHVSSDGRYVDILATSGGVSSTREAGYVFMQGKEVFRHAVAKMSGAVEQGLLELGLTKADLGAIIPHQANWRIMNAIAQRLEIDDKKVVSTVSQHANTSAASIPLAFAQAMREGRLKNNDLIAMPALGAGLTWGCCIIRL